MHSITMLRLLEKSSFMAAFFFVRQICGNLPLYNLWKHYHTISTKFLVLFCRSLTLPETESSGAQARSPFFDTLSKR